VEAPPDSHPGDPAPAPSPDSESRAARLALRRGWRRRSLITLTVLAVVAGAAAGGFAFVFKADNTNASASPSPAGEASTTAPTTTTTRPPASTTSTTVPVVKQPPAFLMPSPGSGLSWGSSGPVVKVYEARMKQLHLDPGPIDGVFGQATRYAVQTVQKYYGLPRTGVITTAVDLALTHFRYSPAEPNSEPDRVEIDLDRQVLTLYHDWQPVLLTTTSTGSGEHFCGGVDGCQYAITQTGHFHFYDLIRGWQKGKLGTMWNPYYFNGSDAVHGLQSVPAYPASHGCARIPMHVADYFYTLVHQGESVFVVGTPMHTGNGYVGPIPTPPPTTTTAPKPTPTTPTTAKKPKTATTVATPTTKPHTTPTTKKP
jgi:peptidoglycan hydrolase-like protein with peptidoglycan-binding domain